jgi:polysaccharide deacetylase 2 family uncharacterized protein YibQ
MTANDLTIPLGQERDADKPPRRKLPLGKLLAGLCLCLLAGVGGLVAFTSDPLGGEPVATASIQKPARTTSTATEGTKTPADTANVKHLPADDSSQQRQAAADLETESGVRVTRQNGQAPGSVVIRVPDAQPTIRLATAPDRRLVERGRHGNLPKIGPDGLRPADIYARPVTPQQRAAPVRIAIVIGGLGISTNTTQDAIQRLPSNISLAFAPYGADLERQVAKAREDGHEVLLQAPMEPFDYPDNDPGPHTLVASLPPEKNMDRLQWLLARFPGYVGVINFMGGRFTANDAVLAPVMKEIAGRGLLDMDDGSSGRSLAPQAAASAGASATRADVVIDAVQRAPEIDAALARLEKIAREKGSAVGYGVALPVTIERLSRWAKTVESRGITLVPVSALVSSPRRS